MWSVFTNTYFYYHPWRPFDRIFLSLSLLWRYRSSFCLSLRVVRSCSSCSSHVVSYRIFPSLLRCVPIFFFLLFLLFLLVLPLPTCIFLSLLTCRSDLLLLPIILLRSSAPLSNAKIAEEQQHPPPLLYLRCLSSSSYHLLVIIQHTVSFDHPFFWKLFKYF